MAREGRLQVKVLLHNGDSKLFATSLVPPLAHIALSSASSMAHAEKQGAGSKVAPWNEQVHGKASGGGLEAPGGQPVPPPAHISLDSCFSTLKLQRVSRNQFHVQPARWQRPASKTACNARAMDNECADRN